MWSDSVVHEGIVTQSKSKRIAWWGVLYPRVLTAFLVGFINAVLITLEVLQLQCRCVCSAFTYAVESSTV